jgi:hypothetical protein
MKSKIHHCVQQELVVQGLKEPPARTCRCKEMTDLAQATKMVSAGEAAWVVTKRTRGVTTVPCELCDGDKDIKNCASCHGTGTEEKAAVWDTYNNEIVCVSRPSVDPNEKKRRSGVALKTPRVATIEFKHIVRAYLDEVKEARERIEEYGRLILDARVYVGKDRIPAIGVEPKDNKKTHEGRTYDFGRTV